jgi:hypothetical protein
MFQNLNINDWLTLLEEELIMDYSFNVKEQIRIVLIFDMPHPYSLVEVYQWFGGMYCLHHQG